jgi:3-methyladenine DNA glycosylase AlkD
MSQGQDQKDVLKLAAKIDAELRAAPVANTPSLRAIRRRYSSTLKGASPEFVLDLARILLHDYGQRWIAYELIHDHRAAFRSLGEAELEELGQGIESWWTVDAFARTLSGPAWLNDQLGGDLIQRWARSDDLWWRRAALVSTVALNVRSQGGMGDTPRTLAVCRLLVDDHEDMVVKALSWALRELAVHDPQAVEAFLGQYQGVLAKRVQREVQNKLNTGLKNPKRRQG